MIVARPRDRTPIPAAVIEQYDRLIATQPGVERKGATMPYTSVNGHMFSYLAESGRLALRLPSPQREAFIERFKTTLQEAYGFVQKEYVSVPEAVLADTQLVSQFFRASHAYVSGLKPKPTRRTAR